MTSEAKIESNRRNAQASTGPRTDEGKANSAQNRLTHGLEARKYAILGEDPEAFERLVEELFLDIQPVGERERELTRAIALAHWQIQRLSAVEASVFSYRIGEVEAANAESELVAAGNKRQRRSADRSEEPLKREDNDVRATAERTYSEKRQFLRGDEVLLGRAFTDDALGPDAFSKLSRYSRGILTRLTALSGELRRLQHDRLHPDRGDEDEDE